MCLLAPYSVAKPAPAVAWNGQYLGKGQGAVYVNLNLKGFKRSKRGKTLLNDIVIRLKHNSSGRYYVISQQASNKAQPQYMWILPVGIYTVRRITFIDNAGLRRVFQSQQKTIAVSSLNLSYLGLWDISPGPKSRLKVNFKANKSRYKHQFEHQTFVALIDGLTGKEIRQLGGEEVRLQSQSNFGSQAEARAVFTEQVNVAMYYKIDLGKYNQYASSIAKTIQSQEVSFRKCYTDYLQTETGQGSMGFRFIIEKSSGIMGGIKHIGGSLKDDKLQECLYYNLGLMQFPLSRKILGKITFLFKTQ